MKGFPVQFLRHILRTDILLSFRQLLEIR
jgi:GTPase involved in cell partitioning and DNA repair